MLRERFFATVVKKKIRIDSKHAKRKIFCDSGKKRYLVAI